MVTTDASCGAVNSMHDSFTPLGGLVPLVNIELGEVVFGGVGAGLYGMLMFAILAVFIAGLMVGRTPEYLGKKIEQKEVKMVMLAVLVLAVCILGFSRALAHSRRPYVNPPAAMANNNGGPHGLSRNAVRLHQRRRQQRQRLRRHQRQHALVQHRRSGIAMLCGRFLMMIPLLAAAGSLAQKKHGAGLGGNASRRTVRCSWCCWWAWW